MRRGLRRSGSREIRRKEDALSLSAKRKIILSAAFILIGIFLGLETEIRKEIGHLMSWNVYVLSFYGLRIMTGGGLFHPSIGIAEIGYYKYWLCGFVFMAGVILFIAVRARKRQ